MGLVNNVFELTSFTVSKDRYSVVFTYTIILGRQTKRFEEELVFPVPIPIAFSRDLLHNLLFSLHLILGVSYYKMYCPRNIQITSGKLTKNQSEFWNRVYTKGLGEFFYRNKIDFRGLVNFPYVSNAQAKPVRHLCSERILLGIGGGKDSLVSYETLQKAGRQVMPFVVETNRQTRVLQNLLTKLSRPQAIIRRKINPDFFKDSLSNRILDGHVPVSAINAFIGVFACFLFNCSYFVVSNEKSSDFGNVSYLDMEINHQWSKSSEFEQMMQVYVKKYISPSVIYFSVLRPFSELAIMREFTKYRKYFRLFSSCNRNFSLKSRKEKNLWCGVCPKCVFVFTLLTAFLPKKVVVKIFGNNLYENQSLLPLFRNLWGSVGIKPFECVGTPNEMIVALFLTQQKEDYKSDPIIKVFQKEIRMKNSAINNLQCELFSFTPSKTIPHDFTKIISRMTL